ncbi:PREDICTED: TSL-kinase interacting protein 1-like isoform X2 [Camelina sativa]|nr:PREDICTED: TSL-kinase interacting protein 1-like isoform X2 [Camelina sativa]XP_010446479.1 PREDICTED: TSL-kinase interacting protein 1-like isoform X2 [Camelina sativa]
MARKRTKTATEPSKEIKEKGRFTRANKCMKTTTKKSHDSGKNTSGKEEKSPSKCSAESPSSLDQKLLHTPDRAQKVPVLDLHSCKEVPSSGKMKLQLFPLDLRTREGLEKDGFHPYLELTLSSRKKISSVLQHIHSKWGSSEIALGDPTLYPYDKPLLASGHKWIANSNITTGAVYEAIGAPPLFRLRYGWSSDIEHKTHEPPCPSTPGIACFQNEELHNNGNKVEGASFTGKQMLGLDNPITMLSSSNQVTAMPPSENIPTDEQVESKDNKIHDESGPTLLFWDDGLTSLSIGGLLSEVSLKGNFGNHSKSSNATLWEDNLTNISIGGLFSEASLQDRCNIKHQQEPAHYNNNGQSSGSIGGFLSEASPVGEGKISDCSKTWETKRAIQQAPLPLISDSLNAFLDNQTDRPRIPCSDIPPEPSHLSIFDAEDTCHAFSFRKRTTTSPKVHEQVNGKAEKEQQKDDSKPAKPLFGSTVFNQDSSLGFSGIKWAESRGPFDFGLSSSRKFTNGDSVSFGAVVKDLQEMEPLEEKTKIQKSPLEEKWS